MTPNSVLAKRFGMSVSTIRRMAKEMDLEKNGICRQRFNTWLLVQQLFGLYSYNEIAQKAGISSRTVRRIAKSLDLNLKKEEKNKIIAESVSKGLKSERRKKIFGLETKYNRPVGRDGARRKAFILLKEHGYLVIKGSMTAYYSDTMERHEDIEEQAIASGFRMVPWI